MTTSSSLAVVTLTMRSLTELAVIIVLLTSVSESQQLGCKPMTTVYNELVGSGHSANIPESRSSVESGQTCGATENKSCCSRSMEISFIDLLRSLLNTTRAQAKSFSHLLKVMGETKERNLGTLEQHLRITLLNSTRTHCHGIRTMRSSVYYLFSGVVELYRGTITSLLEYVVTFFYSIANQYLGLDSTGWSSAGMSGYGFKVCVANWGHTGRFTQNDSSLIRIACCLDKFVLLSERIAVSLFNLSDVMADVKSNLIRHSCRHCKDAFVQNMLCHRCTGDPTMGSCPSACTDVIHRCFPNMTAVNDAWNDVLDSIEEVVNETRSSPNICSCMSVLDLSLEVVCKAGATRKSSAQRARKGKASDSGSLIRRMVENCSGSGLTDGDDHGIADFLSQVTVSSRYNILSPCSCLGRDGNGEALDIYDLEFLRGFRDIMMPRSGIFRDFCKLPNSSEAVLVSYDSSCTCWNGSEVINVEQDKDQDYSNSQDFATHTECLDNTYQKKKQSLYKTCCTKPEEGIISTLKNIAKRNREFLCREQDYIATNSYCKQCKSE